MIQEIYTRMPTDTKYNPNILDTHDEVERILTEIRTILGTKHGEVLGDPNFGIDLEQYVFSYGIRKQEILKNLKNQIDQYLYYDPEKYTIDLDLNYGKDLVDRSDYAVLDIIINQLKLQGILIK